ncbi:hypothetical protein D6810_01145 [Candidatus Dojkabacteria bacterium]|uniref:NAD(P)-binding domain-containing protein n=1 Tax=Candidatus Dojkabacteria bacterium TaxID=2099670 RepID=A0A3M0Z139_9BACT|nr:MAG: hypothetical protein D6810_01145 [Candidatus Dojkabacteria bacterium]
MKISLLGSSGRLGSLMLREFLSKKIKVRALVRSVDKFKRIFPNFFANQDLEVLQGDALNLPDLEKLIDGCDAVVSCLGHRGKNPRFMQRDVFTLLSEILEIRGPKRLISITGSGVFLPGDSVTLFDKLMLLPIKLLDPERVEDGKEHVRVLLKSKLDWTVIRTPVHTNFGNKHTVSDNLNGELNLFVNRRAIINFVLEVLYNNTYINKAPVIRSKISF